MNPRIKKIARNILFLLSIPVIVSAFVFANVETKQDYCTDIEIHIENPSIGFVQKEDIFNNLEQQGIVQHVTKCAHLNLDQIEKELVKNKWILFADSYITANGHLHVKVKQKEPIVRILTNDSSDYSYYLDCYANPIEVSEKFHANVPVVTSPRLGYIRKDLQVKQDLVKLANFIAADTFWNRFITQANVNAKRELELIPAIGNQTILLGNVHHLEDKMNRILAFYQQGMHTVDWTKYNQFDVRFDKQVIARNTNITAFEEKKLLPDEEKMVVKPLLTTAKKSTEDKKKKKKEKQQQAIRVKKVQTAESLVSTTH
jgi:cell division protein FtsQ